MPTKHIPEGLERHLQSGRTERALIVERQAVDEAARTATLAFASEMPYERWWGIEILDCTATAMRTSRLRSGANLLCDHDSRDVVGVIESVEIGADRVGRAVVRFGKSVRAEEVWQDVLGGIRRNVSVGYIIHKAQLVETNDGQETYRVSDWEPFEVSLVSVPADASVGVGRNLQPDTTPPTLDPIQTPKEKAMPEIVAAAALAAAALSASAIDSPAARNHPLEITRIAATIPGGSDLAMRSIQAGHTVEQFQQEALRTLASKPVPTADIGLTET